MKKLIMSLMAFSIIALVSVNALAQGKNLKEEVTFKQDVWINTTSVKPGTYIAEYNAQSGEVNFLDSKKKVVATAKATVTTSEKKFPGDALMTTTTPNGSKLTGIRLGGQREEIVITDTSAQMSKSTP